LARALLFQADRRDVLASYGSAPTRQRSCTTITTKLTPLATIGGAICRRLFPPRRTDEKGWNAQQDPQEQVRLLKTLLSNCAFDRGSLVPTYVKPFELLVAGNDRRLAVRKGFEPFPALAPVRYKRDYVGAAGPYLAAISADFREAGRADQGCQAPLTCIPLRTSRSAQIAQTSRNRHAIGTRLESGVCTPVVPVQKWIKPCISSATGWAAPANGSQHRTPLGVVVSTTNLPLGRSLPGHPTGHEFSRENSRVERQPFHASYDQRGLKC
jgi:hypothetical protein